MNLDKLARELPRALLVVAFFDFVKNLVYIWSYWHQNQYYQSTYGNETYLAVSLGLAERAVGLIIYPLGWIVSATIIHLLLAIRDGKGGN